MRRCGKRWLAGRSEGLEIWWSRYNRCLFFFLEKQQKNVVLFTIPDQHCRHYPRHLSALGEKGLPGTRRTVRARKEPARQAQTKHVNLFFTLLKSTFRKVTAYNQWQSRLSGCIAKINEAFSCMATGCLLFPPCFIIARDG